MRAYMSVPGVRAVCYIGPVRDSQHAEAEAREIIRELEPECGIDNHVSARELGAWGRSAWALPMGPALAEALAAFCDEGQEC